MGVFSIASNLFLDILHWIGKDMSSYVSMTISNGSTPNMIFHADLAAPAISPETSRRLSMNEHILGPNPSIYVTKQMQRIYKI